MRPTLYANDIPDDLQVVGDVVPALNGAIALRNVKRILPLRCFDSKACDPLNDDEFGVGHQECDGRGFLYPDPPDWWTAGYVDEVAATMEQQHPGTLKGLWEEHLRETWRAMGILEEDR